MWKKEDDWFWEGNVQRKIVHFLEEKGYMVADVDTLSKSRGPDIVAEKPGDRMIMEVKGWPADKYVDGSKQGQPKKTRPTTQAGHWFGEAVLSLIKRKRKYPTHTLALGFPDSQRYRKLLKESQWALERLEVQVYFVSESGLVERAI